MHKQLICILIAIAFVAGGALATTTPAPATQPSTQPAAPALAGYVLTTEWVDPSGDVTFIYSQVPKPVAVAVQTRASASAASIDRANVPARVASPPINSVNHTADQVISNVIVRGIAGAVGGQNIVCQNYAGGLTVSNVVSLDAWGASQFGGQCIYLENIAGPVVIQDSYFGWGGRPRAPHAPETATPYKHDLYANDSGGTLTVQRCIFAQSSNAGVQSRFLKGTTVAHCDFLDCATALLLIEGGATLTDNVVYGGQYQFDGTGFTSDTAIRSYWPVLAKNNWIVTRPGQLIPTGTANHPGAKYSPQGAVNMGGQWVHTDPVWTPPPTSPAEFLLPGSTGNFISPDWPGGLWWGPTKGLGFSVLPAPGPALDYAPILLKIEQGGTVAAADAAIRAALLPH